MLKTLLMTIAIVLFGVVGAVAGESVAWVDSYQGKADNYALLRDGKMVPVAIYLSLEVGDEVAVRQDGDALQLSYADGRSDTVTSKNSPYKISSDVETPSVATNMLAWVGRSLNKWHDNELERNQYRAMVSRSLAYPPSKPKLYAPLFNKGENFVVAGKRQLTIPWRGGRGPYSVSIFENGIDAPVYQVSEIEGDRIKTGEVNLKAGNNYKIEISDVGETVAIVIVAKDSSKLPTVPDEFSQSKLPGNMRSTVLAAWLAGIHDDWVFEGYQKVAGADSSYAPAMLLKLELEQGLRPE